MTTARLPGDLPRLLEEFGGEMLGIPLNEWTVNGAITAGAAAPFSLVVNEAIDAAVPAQGWLTTENGEVLHWNAVNTGTKTFTIDARAQMGTVAAELADDSAVGQYLTRDQWNQIVDELIAMATTGAGSKGADIASAAALTLGADGDYFHVTGTTAITSISARRVGAVIALEFDAALVLTHHATDLILRGGANVTTAAGDVFTFVSEASGDWREIGRCTISSIGAAAIGDLVDYQFVRKTADTTTNTDTTLSDDPHLTIAIGANETWTFECVVFYSGGNTTMDMKVAFTVPAAATILWGLTGAATGATADDNGALIYRAVAASGTSAPVGTVTDSVVAIVRGIVVNGANSGSITLQTAQQTSDAGTLTVKTNSYLTARRVA